MYGVLTRSAREGAQGPGPRHATGRASKTAIVGIKSALSVSRESEDRRVTPVVGVLMIKEVKERRPLKAKSGAGLGIPLTSHKFGVSYSDSSVFPRLVEVM